MFLSSDTLRRVQQQVAPAPPEVMEAEQRRQADTEAERHRRVVMEREQRRQAATEQERHRRVVMEHRLAATAINKTIC